MTWFKVINCVNTELFPVLAITLKKCIDEKLSEDSKFKPDDFDDKVVDDVMKRLKAKRTMNNKEIEYLMALFQRAVDSQKMEKKSIGTSIALAKCKDISPKWPELTVDILYDIFGAHKALLFGRLQRAEYSGDDFIKSVETAEKKIFEDNICTPHISKDNPRFALSFYPQYLINDDIFQVMTCHFAVSAVVSSMQEKLKNNDESHFRSVVIPAEICSRYDIGVQYQRTITNVLQLTGMCGAKSGIYRDINCNLDDVLQMAGNIGKMISQLNYDGYPSNNIAIVFHRYRVTNITVAVFACDDWSKLDILLQNYFLCFDFHISSKKVISDEDSDQIVRCWLTFGMGQRLRFYPEYVVWIIPHLFVRPTNMTAHKFLEGIYGEQYKHGWRVSLDDPIFNKYYHIITQHEHISNNYNRDEVEEKQKEVQRLLRDHLDGKLRWNVAVKLRKFVVGHAYDSDTILEDMEDPNDSNIASYGSLDHAELRHLKFEILKFRNMECKEDPVSDLAECEHIDILIETLRKFQECGLEIDALNVIQFDVDSVITAFDHIIKVHGFLSEPEMKLKIQDYVAKHVSCNDGAECCILKEHSERTRERENIEEKRDELVHEVDTLCEVTADTLHSVHCYILHRDVHLYRLLSGRESDIATRFSTTVDEEERKEDAEELKNGGAKKEVRSHGINFGLNVLRWLPYGEQPHSETLNDEIMRNPESTIDAPIFQQYLMICIAKIKDTNYTVNEMMCMKLYTDTNELQSQLRKAHWTKASLETRKGYYQWAMGLYRSHLYHAVPIPTASSSSSKPCRLYHGLNRLFTVSREMPIYFGPFSTTIAKTVASTFCNNKGLIWLLQSSYANPLKLVVGINVDWISGFKHEREVLLYNQCLPIQETETFDDDSDILMNHFIHSLISRESPIIKKDTFYKQLGVGLDAEWMRSIFDHELLFERTECNKMRVVDRLVMELGVIEPDLVVKLWNTKHDDKSELEYLVDNLGAYQLSNHHRVLTTKFKMLHFSPLLNRSWLRSTGTNNDVSIKESEYEANEQNIDTATTCSVKGKVTKIKVKNVKLFGNHSINLQTFNDAPERTNLSSDFVDSLMVDRYGFVFADNIPKHDHQFQVGDAVQYKEKSQWIECVVSRVLSHGICVKIGDGVYYSFQWIEKALVPMTVVLPIPHQKDIGKYEFVIRTEADHEAPSAADYDAKKFSFRDIMRFEIPCLSMMIRQSDAVSMGICAKPKGTDFPFTLIKFIKYPPDEDQQAVHVMDVASKTDTVSMVNQLVRTLKDSDSEIQDNVAFLHSFGLDIDRQSEWIQYISTHSMLFDDTTYRRKLVIERLIVELNLMDTDWIHRILEQTKNDKPMLNWLVEDWKVFKLLDHYRVMTSKFKMEKYSKLLNCSWFTFERNTKVDDTFGIKSDDTMCYKRTEYRTNEQTVSFPSRSVDGPVDVIIVRNSELFGAQRVTLQHFQREEDGNEVKPRYGLRDMFDIDDMAVVPVQVGRNQRMQINQNGHWVDAIVSRVTADKICVKLSNDDIHSFLWIKREDIWNKIKIQNQNEISEFEFAARAGMKGDAKNLTNVKRFTFGDIGKFQIKTNLLTASSRSLESVHIYAKPKGKNVGYHHIRTVEHRFGPWFFSRYFVDGNDPFCIDEEVKVNPYSESLNRGGRFEVLSSSKIVISKCGGINASECGLKMNSKHHNRSILKFGGYIDGINAKDDANSEIHVDGSGGGAICLIAVGSVVTRGNLSCKGTEGGLFSGGIICILSDGVIENSGDIDGGQDGEINIQCDRFINEGHIEPTPNVVIGTSKSVNECIRNKPREMKDGLLVDCLRCFDFKHLWCRVLEFSSEFKSTDLMLQERNMWVMHFNKRENLLYVLTTENSVFEGIHCWRIQMKLRADSKFNSSNRWVMWGVSEKKKFADRSYKQAWGVAYNNQWFPYDSEYNAGVQNNGNYINTHDIFRFDDGMEVDMLFDVDRRVLRVCVVGKCGPQKEAKIWNIKHPKDDNCGWVPHLNIQSPAMKVRMASVPTRLYGEPCDDMWP